MVIRKLVVHPPHIIKLGGKRAIHIVHSEVDTREVFCSGSSSSMQLNDS